MKANKIPRVMIASAMSGGGKTTAVCALLRILKQRGMKVQPFKCGPDYIDPMYHRAASGRDGINLDMYFYGNGLKELFVRGSEGADIAVTEGVMGFYDGMSMESTAASSYEIAAELDMPVALVINARSMAYTVIPVIKGIKEFRRNSGVKAVILNNVSGSAFSMLKPVIERETGVKVLGYIPQLTNSIASRHLGLVLPDENSEMDRLLETYATAVAETVDIDGLLSIAYSTESIAGGYDHIKTETKACIAVAYDESFCFYYRNNLDILRKCGAELVFFSPLKDKAIPERAGGVIFGGGYPELYASKLSKNADMLRDIKIKIDNGMPCLAECGGFMYLHSELEGADGVSYKMAGVIEGRAFKTDRLVRFGYAEFTAEAETAYLKYKHGIKGHEFHYWDSDSNGASCTAKKPYGKRSWSCIHADGNLFAGFAHLCYGSNVDFAQSFVDKCGEYAYA